MITAEPGKGIEGGALPFGALLRRYRLAARLTQEELAERAGLSVRGLTYLEAGRRQPFRDTVRRLAEALQLAEEDRGAFIATARAAQISAPDATESAEGATLPLPPAPLIGREHECAMVEHLLLAQGVRLLTLTGPPGVGKTRLALEVAARLRGHYTHGVTFVDLAPLRDPALVPAALARAVLAGAWSDRPSRESLITALQDRHLLMLLDNVEQVAAAAPLLTELVGMCPRLTLLLTSRAALCVRWEHQFAVPPLALPSPARERDPQVLGRSAAVQLFVQRAQAVQPQFALTAANAVAVAQICRRLDGLPLALELAAARSKLLAPTALLARLSSRLTVLTDGPRDLPVRQQTLDRTLAWSYDLQEAPEQALLRRLAVFVGGCTLEAAEAVCAGSGVPADTVLAGLSGLADESLLQVEEQPDGTTRVSLLETIREFGLARLGARGEAEALHQQHARYYLALAEAAEPAVEGLAEPAELGTWVRWLEREHGNLRAALHWAERHGAGRREVPLTRALLRFWETWGHVTAEA